MKHLVVLVGPTASGKTGTAVSLAKKFDCEILSADSRQVFSDMMIGTARPSVAEMDTIKHHLIGHTSIASTYSAGQFAREARAQLENCFQSKDMAILCGGTGLYIKALLEGIDRMPVPPEIRNRVQSIWESEGLDGIKNCLKEAGENLNSYPIEDNPQRLKRILEWIFAGKPIEPFSNWPENWKVLKIGLDLPRPDLYERINQRVDKMIETGLWEEAIQLFPQRHLNALQTVGYQEIFDCISGKFSRDTAIEKIKQHTRNYAKRQLTWFRKDKEIIWFSPSDQAGIEECVFAFSQGA